MPRKGSGKRKRRDRGGDNKQEVGALKTAVREGESFLSTSADDKGRGSFTSAAKALIAVKAITAKGLKSMNIPEGAFAKLSAGTKIEGIKADAKRGLIQAGVDAATEKLFKDFGVRFG